MSVSSGSGCPKHKVHARPCTRVTSATRPRHSVHALILYVAKEGPRGPTKPAPASRAKKHPDTLAAAPGTVFDPLDTSDPEACLSDVLSAFARLGTRVAHGGQEEGLPAGTRGEKKDPGHPGRVVGSLSSAAPRSYAFFGKETYVDFEDMAEDAGTDAGDRLDRRVATARVAVPAPDAAWEGERYENVYTPSYSKHYYKFDKERSKHPWQLIRYAWHGVPLLHVPWEGMGTPLPPQCAQCANPMHFECQLMPAIPYLLAQEMDWFTILVYSCSHCYQRQAAPRPGAVFMERGTCYALKE